MDRRSSDEYDGLPPHDFEWPSPFQRNLAEDVGTVALDFERCALRPDNAWYSLSHGCLGLDTLARKKGPQRLTSAHRDRLLNSILAARYAVAPPGHSSPLLAAGFDAAFMLANHLGETDNERAARHADVVRDALAHLRILRNIAHNQSLAEEIFDRAAQRRGAILQEILASALEAA